MAERDKTCQEVIGESSYEILEWLNNVTAFRCGPRTRCVDGKNHEYTQWEQQENIGTAVCAKCGHRAIDDAFWG